MADKKIKRIQVLNTYVDNKEFDNNSFYLYVILKTICVNNHVNIYKKKLLDKLNWTQYLLRKYLKDLKENRLITYDFDELPKFKPIEINIIPLKHNTKNKEDYFTQVDIGTINKILEFSKEVKIETKTKNKSKKVKRDIKEKALRLFYLYEMYYNSQYACAFIGYDKIEKSMQIHSTYIKSINSMFAKNGLVDVMIGDWRDDSENGLRRRNPNNYVPHCNRYIKDKDDKDVIVEGEK